MMSASVADSVGEATDPVPSQETDAIPLVVLPAEGRNEPEDPTSRYDEDSGEQEHLLEESRSAVRRQSVRPNCV
jgi:hypothetical protein